VLRALGLLKALGARGASATLAELHAVTGLTKPTAHRLLCALESEDFVERSGPGGAFRLGRALVGLGVQALESSDLRGEVRPVLEELAHASGETASLEVRVDDSMLILDAVRGSHLVTGGLEIGTRWPLHATSTGRCWLASMNEPELEALLGTPLAPCTEHTKTDPTQLRSELELVRHAGYAVVHEELEPDYVAVAAGFRDAFGRVEGAISLGGPASRMGQARVRELGEALRTASERLSVRHGA